MGQIKSFSNNCISLIELRKKYRFKTSIETGCYKGDSLEYLSMFYFLENIYSCDIESSFVEHCKKRFEKDTRIKIYNQPSHDFLKFILPTLKDEDNILFWLDAHYHNVLPFPKYNDIDYPLLSELQTIKDFRGDKNDVIIVDDVYHLILENKSHNKLYPAPKVGIEKIKQIGYDLQLFNVDKGYLLLSNS